MSARVSQRRDRSSCRINSLPRIEHMVGLWETVDSLGTNLVENRLDFDGPGGQSSRREAGRNREVSGVRYDRSGPPSERPEDQKSECPRDI